MKKVRLFPNKEGTMPLSSTERSRKKRALDKFGATVHVKGRIPAGEKPAFEDMMLRALDGGQRATKGEAE